MATALQHVIKITGAKRFENILQSLRIAKRLLFCCTILLQQALAGFSCASLFYAIALSRPLHHSHRDASKPNETERNEKRRREQERDRESKNNNKQKKNSSSSNFKSKCRSVLNLPILPSHVQILYELHMLLIPSCYIPNRE